MMTWHLGAYYPLLLSVAVRGTLMLAVAALVVVCLRRASAAKRHAVWLLALAGLFALPSLTVLLPAFRAPLPLEASARWVDRHVTMGAAPDPNEIPGNLPPRLMEAVAQDFPDEVAAIQRQRRERLSVPGLMVAVWLAGVAAVLLRTTIGIRAVRRLTRRSRPVVEGRIADIADAVAARLGFRRAIRLFLAPTDLAGLPPLMWGWRRVSILLPSAAEDWTDERLAASLLHELSHAGRGDWAALLLARCTCALYWFHPLVWWASERMQSEGERASDDRVLSAGILPTDYASLLLDMARTVRAGSPTGSVAMGMVRRPRVEARLRAILAAGVRRGALSRRAFLGAGALASIAVIPFATLAPFIPTDDSYNNSLPRAITTVAGNRATLKGGVVVELLGIGDTSGGRQTWWGREGRPMARAPYAPVPFWWEDSGMTGREMGVRVTYPVDQEIATHFEVSGPGQDCGELVVDNIQTNINEGAPREVVVNGRKSENRALQGLYPWWQKRTDLVYGVASGPWTTVATVGPGLGAVRATDGSRVTFRREPDRKDNAYMPVDPAEPAGPVKRRPRTIPAISVLDAAGHFERRVVVVDRAGREQPLMPGMRYYMGTRVATVFTCDTRWWTGYHGDARWDDLRAFKLQRRPYEWVRFDGIPLAPQGGITEARRAAEEAVRATPRRYAIRYLCFTREPNPETDGTFDMFGEMWGEPLLKKTLTRDPNDYLRHLTSRFPKEKFTLRFAGEKPLAPGKWTEITDGTKPGDRYGLTMKARLELARTDATPRRDPDGDVDHTRLAEVMAGRVDGVVAIRSGGSITQDMWRGLKSPGTAKEYRFFTNQTWQDQDTGGHEEWTVGVTRLSERTGMHTAGEFWPVHWLMTCVVPLEDG